MDAKDHLKRWITGAVGLTVIVLIVGYGSKPIFFLFATAIILLALHEYYTIVSSDRIDRYTGLLLGLLLTSGFFVSRGARFPGILSAVVIVLFLLFLAAFLGRKDPHRQIEQHLLGVLGVAFLLSHLIWLRDLDHGRCLIFYLLGISFAGDTCALYGGKSLGRHRLAPNISPNKTVEGAVAGLIGSAVAGIMVAGHCLPYFSVEVFSPLTLVLGAAGQLGDLWESSLKRVARVKDSSMFLPGHGGVLDRLDSILFSAPLLYYVVLWLEG